MILTNTTITKLLIFSSLLMTCTLVQSQQKTDSLTEEKALVEVVLVGSRSGERVRSTTVAPVDVFQISRLQQQTPQNDINQILQYISPSFNSNRQSSSDGTEHIDPASIRGLGPDQLLVLVNGKRRHTTSLLNVQGTIGNGSVGTDLNAIPTSSIERIEILRDGSSAQYGSDAIAGIINIVLKKNTNTLFVSTTGAVSSLGDGGLGQLNANYGFGIGKQGGFINITAEAYIRDRTTRTQNHNLIIFDQSSLGNSFTYDWSNDAVASRKYDDDMLQQKGLTRDMFNFQIGDAKIKNIAGFFNLELPFRNKKGHVYAFGGYSYRAGEGYGFRRLPSDSSVNVYSIFANGYQPNTSSHLTDRSLAIGVQYLLGQWGIDLSNTIGNNRFDYFVNQTVNASLQNQSPTSFSAGGHEFLQNTINLDMRRKFDHIGAGLNIAFGGEFRLDNYIIREGEEASWKNYALVTDPSGSVSNPSGLKGGSQSFPGFSPQNATNQTRTNLALYGDIEMDINRQWLVEIAGRLENYSDFGVALGWKVASRYKLAKYLSLRASVSRGFRAPSLHQQYYSYVSTDILPNNTLGASGTFNNTSSVAKALGIPQLSPEKSMSYSLGVVIQPIKNLNLSLDAYWIDIDDRIVITGKLGFDEQENPVQYIQDIINPLGANSATFLSNAINTRTKGIDLVADYTLATNNRKFNASLGFNLNVNEVRSIQIPTALQGQERIFFSPADSVLLTKGSPSAKASLSLQYSYKNWSIMLRNVYFGQVERYAFPYGEIQTFSDKVVTDVSLSYTFKKIVTATIGVNNLLNVYPDVQTYANSYFGVFKYANIQMGTLGTLFFARVAFQLSNNQLRRK